MIYKPYYIKYLLRIYIKKHKVFCRLGWHQWSAIHNHEEGYIYHWAGCLNPYCNFKLIECLNGKDIKYKKEVLHEK